MVMHVQSTLLFLLSCDGSEIVPNRLSSVVCTEIEVDPRRIDNMPERRIQMRNFQQAGG